VRDPSGGGLVSRDPRDVGLETRSGTPFGVVIESLMEGVIHM